MVSFAYQRIALLFMWWRHGPLNSLVTNLRETIRVLPALDSAIGSKFYKLLLVLAKLYAPHIPVFHITTSAITKTTVKQRSFAFIYLFGSHTLRSALFVAPLSTHASPSLFHVLTSFVCTSPIIMLTNRPCHGPWRGLGRFFIVAGNSMKETIA